jgi:glycosyltransferase involved in cell wall biosynthesis
VCTRDRPLALRRCLRALAQLDYPEFEVIVVDNASMGDSTRQVVAATSSRYVREERPGLDWARNRGLATAQHALVAYIDDDAIADPGWLAGLAAAFDDTQVMAATGLVLPAELETDAQHLFELYGGMGKGFVPRCFHRDQMKPPEWIAAHAAGVGANMAFRRAALERLGGFDTALDVGTPANGGGDIDLFHRLLMHGLTLRYEPTALVWHRHRRELGALRRQLYCNGVAYGVYLLKVWLTHSVARRSVAGYGAHWVSYWLFGRLVRRLVGGERLPLNLILAELWGAAQAPFAFVRTYHLDRTRRLSPPTP